MAEFTFKNKKSSSRNDNPLKSKPITQRQENPAPRQQGAPLHDANNRDTTATLFADNRPQATQLQAYHDMAHHRAQVMQLKALQAMMNKPARPNHTGLPNPLKAGIEALSGMSMDHVKVNYNSAKPAQLRAHAYAQGNQIHLAPGQERHLPHEAWHVVQQAQGRVRPTLQMKGGVNVNHDARLEAEADARGAEANIKGAGALKALLDAPRHHLPVVQAVWQYVEETGRERHYNLKDNGDGTFTHGKTGVTYRDMGKQTGTGAALLTPVNSSGPILNGPLPKGSATVHNAQNVLFAIGETGKIEYLSNTPADRAKHAGKFLEMDPKNFAIFKNGGKRSESAKVIDPVTLEKYHYDGKNFHAWDKNVLNGKGTMISTVPMPGQKKSAQDILKEKFKNEALVDRRRTDRTKEDLSPFDVGPYKSDVTMPKQSNPKLQVDYGKLSGVKAWTGDSMETNRDHVPSGESLNQRHGLNAYNQGFTIAIPNYLMHQTFSPTFGSDNSHVNGMDDQLPSGTTQKRVLFDSENPGTAFYRDSSYMLDKTSDQDYSTNHMQLDLSGTDNRARQIGAYRNLYRRNVRLNQTRGNAYGVDYQSPGMDYTVMPRIAKKNIKKATKRDGIFKYTRVKNKTQGKLMVEMFTKNLAKKKLTQTI